jgi:hypothetical protein
MLRNEIISSTSKSIEVRAAQHAPLMLWSDIRGPKHFVQFYESDTFLVHSIADYVSSGLKAGETCIVAATDKHLKMLESVLSQDESLDGLRDTDGFITVDAREALSGIMSGDMPDEHRFRDLVEPLLIKASKRGGGIRIFGELVQILADDGNSEASLQLEALWNRLRTDYEFALYCAYSTKRFASIPQRHRVHICDEHAVVIPDESYTTLKTGTARLSKIASLQHRIRELEAELAGTPAGA